MPMVKPWERQEGESAKNYEAFCVYRDMKYSEESKKEKRADRQRSLRKVAELLRKSETLMARWSGLFNWVDRAEKYDDYIERKAREEEERQRIEEIKKMRERHRKLGQSMVAKAIRGLANLEPEEMSALDIKNLAVEGAKLERVSLGDVGEVIETRDGGATPSAVTFYIPSNNRGDEKKDDSEDN